MLRNKELLAVHQDPLGRQARRVAADGLIETWRKELVDGSAAIGLFNRGPISDRAAIDWEGLGLSRPAVVRDVWSHRDIDMSEGWHGIVPAHGSIMLRVWTSAPRA